VPQPRVALHVYGASSHQAGVFDVVEDEESSKLSFPSRRGQRCVICILGRAANESAGVNIKVDVALHEQGARQVDARWEKEHAATGPGRDVADGLIDFDCFEYLAGAVHLVVQDVDNVRVAELGRIFFRRFGKQHQSGAVEHWLVVEKQDQITRLIQVKTDRIAVDLRLDAIGERPNVAGEYFPLADEMDYLNVDLSGQGETGIVHPVELIESEKTMHKHRLTVHRHFVGLTRHCAWVRRIRGDLGEC